MPKVKKRQSNSGNMARHEPLGQVIQSEEYQKKYAAPIKVRAGKHWRENDQDEEEYLDPKTSQTILQLSKEQQLSMQAEEEQATLRSQQERSRRTSGAVDSDDEEEEQEEIEEYYVDEEDEYVESADGYVTFKEGAMGMSADDEAAIARLMGRETTEAEPQRQTLADIILSKIAEKEAMDRGEGIEEDDDEDALPEKVVQVYTDIGVLLSRYTSGKLPKAFKVIPSLTNWEQVLYLTRPDRWTPQAMYAATRIFASNLNPKMAQRFFHLVLLDAVRADIYTNKKLNYHYYASLKKAVYKPAAFFKGILLPLASDEECTLREAAIVASVLQRVSIPVHHSAVAIHKLAQLKEYNGAASIFIKTLLNKKYSLPAPVISSLVRHFGMFLHDDRELPVLWHQALLVFCQRYHNELSAKDKELIKATVKKHFHHQITPEVRRELFGAQAYHDERRAQQQAQQQSNMVM